ncbi:MAG: AAA family ATPase [Myxococcales bacterium]|nr:AAA family ATPase [Myxococcales bacterium]
MKLYDEEVVQRADDVTNDVIRDVLSSSNQQAVVGVAPAGAGKSYAITTAAKELRAAGLRVAVATPTNEQAFALVRGLAERMPRETITFVPANSVELPAWAQRPNVRQEKAKDTALAAVIVGTLSKFGWAFADGQIVPRDVLLIDEAYQANSVHYYAVGDLAARHLLMGDSGQLAPFTTAPHGDRWRGLDEDPLLTAVEVLERHHPTTRKHRLPVTRRLDPRAVPVVKAFYPNHSFGSAVRPGVREMTLARATGTHGAATLDAVLDRARVGGWAHLELPASAVLTADPETTAVVVNLLKRLFARDPKLRCERERRFSSMTQAQVAVAVSHNDQKDNLRVALDSAGLRDVAVDTANKLQGLTYQFVVAWHPLAGMVDTDDFHLDPGRLCVMLSRHRHACVVVGRAGDRALVEGIPPATPSYVGWDAKPALDGWYAHEAVFAALEPHRVEVVA